MGKTWASFKALQTMPLGTKVLFMSETVVREKTVRDDAEAYKNVYGYHPFDGYEIRFILYQSRMEN